MWKLLIVVIIFIIYNLTSNLENFDNTKKIIIIGNGPSVMNKRLGGEIDKFDKVVRFNTFKNDEKFSPFVGKKTDFWFINAKNIRTKNPEIVKMMENVKCDKIFVEQNPYDPKDKLLKFFPELGNNRKVEFCDINLFNDIQKNHFNPRGMNPHPSLGLQGINLISQKFPEHQIYIYGFDLFKGDKLHYMDKKTKENDNNKIAHNTTKEKQFMNFLIDKYNIKQF